MTRQPPSEMAFAIAKSLHGYRSWVSDRPEAVESRGPRQPSQSMGNAIREHNYKLDGRTTLTTAQKRRIRKHEKKALKV